MFMKRKAPRKAKRSRSLLPSLIITSAIFLFLVAGLFTLHKVRQLSEEITQQFTGKRWSVPASIYARPLELYPGLELAPDMLETELEFAAYREESPISSPGGYNRKGSTFNIVSRDFVFPSGLEKSAAIRVVFHGNTLASILSPDGASIPTVRLDPARIGSIHPLVHEDRVILDSSEIPQLLRESLIIVEDRNFESHHGISPIGILRALTVNLKSGKMVQGGSTLTQQLVKNFFLTSERTLTRKLQEAIMAVILESKFSKDEILTAYVNEVFLGQDGSRAIHGFGLASQFYFRRELQDLSVAQLATLVGMVKGPSHYDPRRNPQNCLARREMVLKLLRSENRISEEELQEAMAEPLTDVAPPKSGFNRYPAFLELVRRQLKSEYREEDLKSEGLRILTTLDPQVQWRMEKQIEDAVAGLKKRTGHKDLQVAMIITGREDGEIQAMAGNVNSSEAGFNRALDARRPIGSLVKPAVYLTALAQGYTLASPLQDIPVSLRSGGKVWQPENYDKKTHGQVALYRALAKSYNLATVNLGMEVGLENIISTIGALGYPEPLAPYPSLLLGAPDMTPLEVSQIYQTIASGGFYMPLRSIQGVMAQDGQLLTRYGIEVEQRFPPEQMYLLNHVLERVFSEGTASGHHFGGSHQYAGKTGTSNDLRDSWFAGYSDTHMAVVWLGRDDNKPTGLSGSSGALVIWGRVMDAIGSRPLEDTEPANIEWARIDTTTLEPTVIPGSNSTLLPFISGTAPQSDWTAPSIDMQTIEEKARNFWDSLNDMLK